MKKIIELLILIAYIDFLIALELIPPFLGDRTCQWKGDTLFIYRGALVAGLRFPFHEFISHLLEDVQVNSCQLHPNAWMIILGFMFLVLGIIFLFLWLCLEKYFNFIVVL